MYNNYNPYNMYGQQQMPQTIPSNIIWVQGEVGAMAYPYQPEPGKKLMLMDTNSLTFWIKETDLNGMPKPMQTFVFTQKVAQPEQNKDYVTKDDMKEYVDSLFAERVKNESTVQ